MSSQWTKTSERLPEEKIVVLTLGENGLEQTLKRIGNLWFFPDESMYVYYTPKYWKHVK